MRIDIYGKPQCPWCNRAKELAGRIVRESSQQNHTYAYLTLDIDFTLEELFEKVPDAKTFPQILIDGKSIGGYQNFFDYMHGGI